MSKEKIIRLFYISIFTIIFSLLFFYPRIQDSKITKPISNQLYKYLVTEYATQCFSPFVYNVKENDYTNCRGEFSEIEINGKKIYFKKKNEFSRMEGYKSWNESQKPILNAIILFNMINRDFHWILKRKPNLQTIEQTSNVIVIILFVFSLLVIWFTRKYSICFVDYFNKFIKIIFKKI